jgi:CO dehydrogenase nickel-insertion accessory protein CooC1
VSKLSDGQIVTFYSYKGGVGRTMALANVSWILASNGKRVLAVDWDLEAPGLHKFFHPFLDESTVGATPGVIELINDYTSAALDPQSRSNDWHSEYARAERHAVSLDWNFPDGGRLDFLSAGRQNRDYSAAVCTLDWDNFYERLGGGHFFRAMRNDMKKKYDYVLIDSRTGLSDVADICTIELPDVLAVCFTLSDQSIEGAANVARQISSRYRDRNIRVLPVPMRIEAGDEEKLGLGRTLARVKFEGFPVGMSAEESARYWAAAEVPSKPFYAFEEILATFGDDPSLPGSLLSSYERITASVTGGQVTAMRPMVEEVRLQYMEVFTRRQPPLSPQVYLSYVPEDRMWADWIETVLTRAGVRVLLRSTMDGVAVSNGDVRGIKVEREFEVTSRVIVVLSSGYLNSPEARSVWSILSVGDDAAVRRRLVPVKVGEIRMVEPFTGHAILDLARIDAAHATAKLLSAFDLPAVSPGSAGPQMREARFPGSIPPIWRVPGRNADFTGRSAELEQLRDRFTGGGISAVVAQSLYGLGGLGKTQLALEYAHRFMGDYDLVWWVPSGRAEKIAGALADLAHVMGLHVSDDEADAATSALEELRRNSALNWLLVFDDANDAKQLEPYLPAGSGHVLITSRNQAWAHSAEPLEVDVFTRSESVAHLLRHVPGLDIGDAGDVCEAVGDLPLAIEQASAWLEQTGMSAQAYVDGLATQATRILSLNPPPDYQMTVVAAWNQSVDQLRARSPAAVRLLQLCSFFPPGTIPLDLIYSEEMNACLLPFDAALTAKYMLGQVVRDISLSCLAKVDQANSSLEIHRLVQSVIRSQMTDEERSVCRHEMNKILAADRPWHGEPDNL